MKLLQLFTLGLFCNFGFSQSVNSTYKIHTDKAYYNICLHKIDGDEFTTQCVLREKGTVRTHQHKNHSEAGFVMEGKARFYFEDSSIPLKKEGFVFIPKHTGNSFGVKSKRPMKVISNQSPAFFGGDRILKMEIS